MKSEETMLPAIELFHKRMGLRKWGILADSNTMDYSISIVNAIESEYRDKAGEMMNIVLKRCLSQKSNISAPNCVTARDCYNNEDCVTPLIQLDTKDFYKVYAEIEKWLILLRTYNPEILILNGDENIKIYLAIIKKMKWSPKVILGTVRSYTLVDPRLDGLDTSYLYYAVSFSENQEYKYNNYNGYMGSTDEFIKYIDDNWDILYNDTTYPLIHNYDFVGNYEYLGRGGLIGVTIQRIVELSSTIKKVNYKDDDEFFKQTTVNSIKGCIYLFIFSN